MLGGQLRKYGDATPPDAPWLPDPERRLNNEFMCVCVGLRVEDIYCETPAVMEAVSRLSPQDKEERSMRLRRCEPRHSPWNGPARSPSPELEPSRRRSVEARGQFRSSNSKASLFNERPSHRDRTIHAPNGFSSVTLNPPSRCSAVDLSFKRVYLPTDMQAAHEVKAEHCTALLGCCAVAAGTDPPKKETGRGAGSSRC